MVLIGNERETLLLIFIEFDSWRSLLASLVVVGGHLGEGRPGENRITLFFILYALLIFKRVYIFL